MERNKVDFGPLCPFAILRWRVIWHATWLRFCFREMWPFRARSRSWWPLPSWAPAAVSCPFQLPFPLWMGFRFGCSSEPGIPTACCCPVDWRQTRSSATCCCASAAAAFASRTMPQTLKRRKCPLVCKQLHDDLISLLYCFIFRILSFIMSFNVNFTKILLFIRSCFLTHLPQTAHVYFHKKWILLHIIDWSDYKGVL